MSEAPQSSGRADIAASWRQTWRSDPAQGQQHGQNVTGTAGGSKASQVSSSAGNGAARRGLLERIDTSINKSTSRSARQQFATDSLSRSPVTAASSTSAHVPTAKAGAAGQQAGRAKPLQARSQQQPAANAWAKPPPILRSEAPMHVPCTPPDAEPGTVPPPVAMPMPVQSQNEVPAAAPNEGVAQQADAAVLAAGAEEGGGSSNAWSLIARGRKQQQTQDGVTVEVAHEPHAGSPNLQVIASGRGQQASAAAPSRAAAPAAPHLQSSAAVSAAAAAAMSALLAQARRSVFDPATAKARCRACGKAFSTYVQLAQHLQ